MGGQGLPRGGGWAFGQALEILRRALEFLDTKLPKCSQLASIVGSLGQLGQHSGAHGYQEGRTATRTHHPRCYHHAIMEAICALIWLWCLSHLGRTLAHTCFSWEQSVPFSGSGATCALAVFRHVHTQNLIRYRPCRLKYKVHPCGGMQKQTGGFVQGFPHDEGFQCTT